MFKTETLTAFMLVAKHGSFTAAAAAIQQTPMAMSKQVSLLEAKLGEALFERTTRKVNLTQFGEEFRLQAEKILSQHELLHSWLALRQGNISGTLSIVTQAPEIYQETIFPWLGEFHQKYPDIKLECDVVEKIIDLEHSRYDIYWGVGDYLGVRHPGLKRRSLWQSHYGIYASPGYLAKYGTPATPDELQHHQLIGYLHNQPSNLLIVNKSDKSAKDQPEYLTLASPVKTVTGFVELAAQGLGLINLAADDPLLQQHLKAKTLLPVLENYWWPGAEVFLYYQQVKFEQPKVRAFIDFFMSKKVCW
ncbi:LysR family transcriptional regulator [Thalassomonas actiniarum]|uniref:LysR family transcriptional regulator n=1 Tax=Thalassomonas actiniarum TaxID=485447 RepID=A0AAE9YLR7_9GAMM|nr:LysR family transcriptional regulator [Thalassomonas actiniarum]WDD97351.1 LysR family transcriptional regulator [Thalassomonas actiniarum]